MSANNSPLTLALVAALASSLTMHFVGYQNNKYSHPYGRDLERGSASKQGRKPRAGGVGDFFADELCQDFCATFFRDCSNYNPYINPQAWAWESNYGPNRRALGSGNVFSGNVRAKTSKEPGQGRKNTLEEHEDALGECLRVCMAWPRPLDPANYTDVDGSRKRDSSSGGDHFWCRAWHVRQAVDLNSAAFHCPHATDSSLGICRDINIDGYSPYEWLQRYASTQHRHPFCDVAGPVVDCTMGGINDDNFHDVLQSLPEDMEILFLNGNSITKINGPLAQHLNGPTNLRAIYINDNGLKTVSADAFKGLDNLEVWNADVNEVATLDKDFLKHTPNLRHFSMHTNTKLFTPSFPAGFWQHTPKLQVMFTQGTGVSTFLPGTFDGLTKLTIASFVGNEKITEKSFPNPPELFKDLTSLYYFDFFGNPIKSIPANFFGPWASKIIRLAFWNCPIESIHKNAGLENLESLEQAYFHSYDGGEGGSFDYAPVLQIFNKINPDMTMTYGTTPAPTPSLREG